MLQESVENPEPLISDHFQRTMERRAAWFLQGGEKVRSAAYGARRVGIRNQSCAVILTDHHVYLTKPGVFKSLAKVLEKHEIGAVHVWFHSTGFIFNTLWIGAEPVRFLGRRRRLEKLAAAASDEAAGLRE
jgi:hypothetical protein